MKVLALLVVVAVAIEAKPHDPVRLTTDVGYIVGGENASPGEFPWQVSLQRCSGGSCSHNCGAVVMNANWVLTAAHCIQNPVLSSHRLVFGLHTRSDETGTQARTPSIVTPHPDFVNDGSLGFPNDVGVMKFDEAINLSGNVAAATLVPSNVGTLAGQACTISGWGRTAGGAPLANILQKAETRVLSTAECQAQGIPQADDDMHICLNNDDQTTNSCNGDSGGPLNCPIGPNNSMQIAGITSFGIIFCPPSRPAGYARVSFYRQWIEDNMTD
ncbi:DgyrCDS14480 [Dimorphilus gyrociliatus]|uniref:DgyrCDS14480 n=1 Tax=Dimorphilus gyrociliatus TaxID=2664684 RepID=A0A7I8WDY2_9ANNE|nr:DgyrCDS14480 [Dimorphilus gyrociliatus]